MNCETDTSPAGSSAIGYSPHWRRPRWYIGSRMPAISAVRRPAPCVLSTQHRVLARPGRDFCPERGSRAPGRTIWAISRRAVTRNRRRCRRPQVVAAKQDDDSRKSKLVWRMNEMKGRRGGRRPGAGRPRKHPLIVFLAGNAARARRNSPSAQGAGRPACAPPPAAPGRHRARPDDVAQANRARTRDPRRRHACPCSPHSPTAARRQYLITR